MTYVWLDSLFCDALHTKDTFFPHTGADVHVGGQIGAVYSFCNVFMCNF